MRCRPAAVGSRRRASSPRSAMRGRPPHPGLYVVLAVATPGGASRPDQPRMFEPYFTTKPAGKGTGLGLATVFGIVQQHKGWIEVDSIVDHGTAFRLFFPALELIANVARKAAIAHQRVRYRRRGRGTGGTPPPGGIELPTLMMSRAASWRSACRRSCPPRRTPRRHRRSACRPRCSVVAGRVAVAREDVAELRRPVAHHDLGGHPISFIVSFSNSPASIGLSVGAMWIFMS